MSIASEITRITDNVADAYTAANAKGATMPVTQNSDNLASTINTISSGGVDTAGWIPRDIDANGKLVGSTRVPNFSGVQSIGTYALHSVSIRNNNITGTISFPNLLRIDEEYACDNAFERSPNITAVSMPLLTTMAGGKACQYMFQNCTGIISVDLHSLETVSGSQGCEYMFQNCTGITSVDLSSLKYVRVYSGCSQMFDGCTGITSISLSSLEEIGYNSCSYMFNGCSNLTNADMSNVQIIGEGGCKSMFANTKVKRILFSSLTAQGLGNKTNQFDNMLSGVTGCTVVFPTALQSVIGNWTSVQNGFGGTNTTVLFGEVKELQVTIPQGYTVVFNGVDISNETSVIGLIGNNTVEGIDSNGRAFTYTFVVDANTTSFTLDVSGLTFNEFQLTSNETGVVFSATTILGGTSYNLTIDANNKVYATAGLTITGSGIKTGMECMSDIVSTNSSTTITVVAMSGPSVVYDSSNIVSSITGDTQYVTADTANDLILFGANTNITGSAQITLTPPANTTHMRIMTEAYSQTENKYDYSYLALGTQRVVPSYSDVKNGVIADGSYLFRQTGVNTEFVSIDTDTLGQSNLVLSFGLAEDSSISGDNTLRIKPIKVYYW